MNIPDKFEGTIYFYVRTEGYCTGQVEASIFNIGDIDGCLAIGEKEVSIDFSVSRGDVIDGIVAGLEKEKVDLNIKVREIDDKIKELLCLPAPEEE